MKARPTKWVTAASTPNGREGDYFASRVGGRLVAGIGQAPPSSPAVWSTYVPVNDLARMLARAEEAGGARLAEPMEAGSDGRLAVVADATGFPFCLWQAGTRVGAELVNEPNAWAMSLLHTSDLERARAFYGAVFGWELEPMPGAPFSQWRLSDQVVAVVTATDGVSSPPHWSVNFAVRDADAIAEHAAALGGIVLMAPIERRAFAAR